MPENSRIYNMEYGEKDTKQSKTERIDFYITVANRLINGAQNALNTPRQENFDPVLKMYGEWIFNVYEFLNDFDQKTALKFFSAPDGVWTPYDIYPQRIHNVRPKPFFYYKEKRKSYVDDTGVKMLDKIIVSVKEKTRMLEGVKLKLVGGIIPNKSSKKICIIIDFSGKISTTKNSKDLPTRKGSMVFKIIKKIREEDGLKLSSLSRELNVEKPNVSRAIRTFNEQVMKNLQLKDKIIIRKSGYTMNKDVYIFSYGEENER